MEHYKFNISSGSSDNISKPFAVVGVVASGNLEVLIENNHSNNTEAFFDIKTSAEGYRETWQAVVSDIASEYKAGGLNFFINDGGAVPAVVSLRLRQAIEEIN